MQNLCIHDAITAITMQDDGVTFYCQPLSRMSALLKSIQRSNAYLSY